MARSSDHLGKRPRVDASATPIDRAIAYACNAPNPHNTQAWKLRNVSDVETVLYVDETRLLPATDPPARQIHIGCGCFIETLAVAASIMGYSTTVADFPEGLYCLDEVGCKPVARITLAKQPTSGPEDLAGYLYARQTNRRPFEPTPISDDELATLERAVADERVQFVVINDRERMEPLLAIFDQAMVIECEAGHLFDETRIWFRFSEKERARRRDGLSLPQTGITGWFRVALLEWYLRRGDPKRWHNKRSAGAYLKVFRRGLASARGLLLLKTATNTQPDWVRTGRAYTRVGLAASRLGLFMHPYSQVLQEYPEMGRLQGEFNRLLGVTGEEKVQMAVRLGRGPVPYYAYRRNLDSLSKAGG